jgi:hypothetical protein
MNMPPTWGSRSEMCSVISFAGDIGYPAKNRHPAIIAASTQASFPCQKSVLEDNDFIFLLPISLNFEVFIISFKKNQISNFKYCVPKMKLFIIVLANLQFF